MSADIKLKQENKGAYVLVTAAGSLSARNILEIRSLFEEVLKIYDKVGMDLSGIDYMDSMGVGILINLYRRVQTKQGRFAIVNPSQVVRDIFEIVDADKIIPIYPTAADLSAVFV